MERWLQKLRKHARLQRRVISLSAVTVDGMLDDGQRARMSMSATTAINISVTLRLLPNNQCREHNFSFHYFFEDRVVLFLKLFAPTC